MTDEKIYLDIEWTMISKIMDFDGEYLFKTNWGTVYDWSKYLLWRQPTSPYVNKFINLLISLGILIKKGRVLINNKSYEKYILSDNYEKIMREMVVEQTTIYKILNRWYDIYVP